jgi:hypothetical protein
MWPQWIVVKKLNNHLDSPSTDVVILDVKSENEYGNFYQIIKYITDAYNNKQMVLTNSKYTRIPDNLSNDLSFYIRGQIEGAAASIIYVSQACIVPGSILEYQDYTQHQEPNKEYTYTVTISDKPDNAGDFNWNITLRKLRQIKELTESGIITKTVKQWEPFISVFMAKQSLGLHGVQRYNFTFENAAETIRNSIFFEEISFRLLNELYSNVGVCPCDICLVKTSCIQHKTTTWMQKHRKITKQCEANKKYIDDCLEFLDRQDIDEELVSLM